jgi:exodeoxyribonuclease-3
MMGAIPGYACVHSLCRDPKNVTFRGGRMYGVATWLRAPLEASRAYTFAWDLEGRVVVIELGGLAIVNVYAVNGTSKPYWDHDLGRIDSDRHAFKRRWNARLFDECTKLRGRGLELVMIGDWNISRTKLDTFPRLRTEEPHALARRAFNEELMPPLDVVDVFRELHPAERKYTWFNRRSPPGRLDAARVDFALVSRSVLPRVDSAEILDAPAQRWLSDHAPLTLRLRGAAKGPRR